MRVLPSRRLALVVAALIAIAVPCGCSSYAASSRSGSTVAATVDSHAPARAAAPVAAPSAETDATASAATPPVQLPAAATTVTVYVVRHAEAESGGAPDPPLTQAGLRRANALRSCLQSSGITAIYASPYRRTQTTAAPLADVLELEVHAYDPSDSKALAQEILERHAHRSVLVVGHSNTVPLIVEALGGDRPPDLDHTEHDPIFILQILSGTAAVTRLRYGAANDTTAAH